jgi:large subunit ribosomal protein L7Ae
VRKVVATGSSAKSTGKSTSSHLIEKTPRNYRIGGDIQHKIDLTRFVKWPRYVRIQRQKRILL